MLLVSLIRAKLDYGCRKDLEIQLNEMTAKPMLLEGNMPILSNNTEGTPLAKNILKEIRIKLFKVETAALKHIFLGNIK